jgi:hypothetical protein
MAKCAEKIIENFGFQEKRQFCTQKLIAHNNVPVVQP